MMKKLFLVAFGLLAVGRLHATQAFIPYIPSTSTHIVDMKLAGAKGDGVTNDEPIFQSTLLNMTTVGGGVLYLPPGTYLMSSPLVTYSSITIVGASFGSVKIKAGASMNNRLIQNFARSNGGFDTNITFSNITFDMNGANQSGSTALTFSKENNLQFTNCQFINPYDTLLLITGNPSPTLNNNVSIDKCIFNGTNQQQPTDVFDVGDGSNVVITNSYFFGSKGGNQGMLEASVINHFVVRDCFFDGNGQGTPVDMKGINGGEFIGNEVKNSTGEGVGFFAWHEIAPFFQGRDFVIANNNIYNSFGAGILMAAPGGPTDTSYNITITGNSIHDNGQEGLKIQTAHELTINNNFLYNNSKSSAGTYASMNFLGAAVSTDVADVRVYGNTFYDTQASPTQTFGYNLNSNVSTMTIHNNFYHQITTAMTKTTPTNINFLDKNNEGVNSFIGSFTRDASLASSAVSVTGVGFKPSSIIFFAVVPSSNTSSSGFGSATTNKCTSINSLTKVDTWGSAAVAIADSTETNYNTGAVTSMDIDGFTMQFTKIGSPTGTITINFRAEY